MCVFGLHPYRLCKLHTHTQNPVFARTGVWILGPAETSPALWSSQTYKGRNTHAVNSASAIRVHDEDMEITMTTLAGCLHKPVGLRVCWCVWSRAATCSLINPIISLLLAPFFSLIPRLLVPSPAFYSLLLLLQLLLFCSLNFVRFLISKI